MNILLTNYMETTYPGGINKVVKEIAKNLSKKNHEITVLQPNPFNLKKEEFYDGFKIIRVKSTFDSILHELGPEIYFYIKKNLKDLNPDIIHLHGYHTLFSGGVIYSISKLNLNATLIFSPHLDIYRDSFAGKYLWRLYNLFGKKIFEKSSCIISVSNFEEQKIIEDYNIDLNKISIISHGVDVIDLERDHNNRSIKKRNINLLYAGHLVERKGVNHILESLNHLIYNYGVKDVVLTIVGDGPEKKKLLKLSSDLELDEYIIWKSFLSSNEYLKSIKETDFFMLLSNSEAYGISIAEALALGTPCIVTNIAGLRDFKDENGCYFVDYPPDPKKVADLIINLKKKEIEVGPFSKKIRTWNKVAEDYEKVYTNFLEGEI